MQTFNETGKKRSFCLFSLSSLKTKEKIINIFSFRGKNAVLVSQTFKIMLAKEVTANAWVRFFLEVTLKKNSFLCTVLKHSSSPLQSFLK